MSDSVELSSPTDDGGSDNESESDFPTLPDSEEENDKYDTEGEFQKLAEMCEATSYNDISKLLCTYTVDGKKKRKTIMKLKNANPTFLTKYCIIDLVSAKEEMAELQAQIETKSLRKDENGISRLDLALGVVYGMVVGDAIGAPLEFSPVKYNAQRITNMGDKAYWKSGGREFNRFRLKSGQWTDDASMGLCLADSLLENGGFVPLDLRLRFLNWWEMGYNNAFGDDPEGARNSVGLGGNIGMSLQEFSVKWINPYTIAGDLQTSGNGSLMRLAAVPVFFWRDLRSAVDVAGRHSKTTHKGTEAAECCRLMTHLIVHAIQASNSVEDWEGRKEVAFRSLASFETEVYSVACLRDSKDEERCDANKHLHIKDRRWNWKSEEHKYCASRAKQMPGYIGSYSMDGLAMALHCVWTTKSFSDALLKAINLGGDSDTVGSITGQIAGAIYGATAIPYPWIKEVSQWDSGGSIGLRAARLFDANPTKQNMRCR